MDHPTNLNLIKGLQRSYVADDHIIEWRAIDGETEYALIRSSKIKAQLISGALRTFKYGVIKYHPLDEALLGNITRPVLNRVASLSFFTHSAASIRPLNGEFVRLVRDRFSNEAELIGRSEAVWVEQAKLPEKLLIYFPGGGYVAGSPATHRRMTTGLVDKLDANVGILVVNYRHAPEASYQDALADAMSVYDHVLKVWGYDPENVILAGDSAGANLAFCLIQDLMVAGKPLPNAMVGISGFYDVIKVLERKAKCAFVCPNKVKEIFHHVFQMHSKQYVDHYNPVRVFERLSASKKAFRFYLQSGTRDTFLTESIYLKQLASQFSIGATLDCFDQMGHVFQMFPTKESCRALQAVAHYINDVFRDNH